MADALISVIGDGGGKRPEVGGVLNPIKRGSFSGEVFNGW